MMKLQSFADALCFARMNRGLTQKQTADAVGLSSRQYRDLELGKADPRLSTAIRLAVFLDIPLDKLKDGEQIHAAHIHPE